MNEEICLAKGCFCGLKALLHVLCTKCYAFSAARRIFFHAFVMFLPAMSKCFCMTMKYLWDGPFFTFIACFQHIKKGCISSLFDWVITADVHQQFLFITSEGEPAFFRGDRPKVKSHGHWDGCHPRWRCHMHHRYRFRGRR